MQCIAKEKVESRRQNTLKVMKCRKLVKKTQNTKDVADY